MTDRKRRLLLFTGIAISVLFLWLAVRGTDPSLVAHALLRADWWLAPLFLAMLFLSYWIKALRWSILLRPLRRVTTSAETFPAVMVGFAGNIILPAQLGELVRMYVVSRQLGLRHMPVLATILLERVFDFLTILLFLAVGLLLSTAAPAANLVTAGYIMGGISILALAFAVLYTTWTELLVRLFGKVTSFLPDGLHAKLIEQLEIAAVGLHSIKSLRLLLLVAVTSIGQWGSLGICIYIAIAALAASVPLPASFLVMALMIAALTLPSSPGYFGPVQLAFTLGLRPFAVDADDALAASIYYHVLAYVSVAVTGLYLVRRMGYTFGEIQNRAELVENAQGNAADSVTPKPPAVEK